MDAGLQLRLRRARRQIESQHSHLHTLYESVADAIAKGTVELVRETGEQLLAAIEAHFSLEDGVFFPAVRNLHPQHRQELNELVREHERYRKKLMGMLGDLGSDGLDAFAAGYRELATSVVDHENREERLLSLLAGDGGAARK
jgi:hypothetical protein